MATFLLEIYAPKNARIDVELLAMRARRAAADVSTEGRRVRCLRSILVPEDETCFLLFEADTADDVRLTAARAEVAFGRVLDAVADENENRTNDRGANESMNP